mmetsp:Transcript_54809/g.102702  ORF Transcript_54809/g.102702 Transcript_54809/m.102702 type:complete len:298 (+) Transcript_54809:72-965(+)
MMWLSPLKAAAKPPLLFSYLLLRATAVLEPTIRETVFAVRAATRDDVAAIQSCNLATLPENYATGFYEQHLHSWPHLAFVAEATTFGTLPTETPTDGASRLRGTTKAGDAALKPRKEVVGYVLGRMERHPPRYPSDVRNTRSGHITSLAVLPSWRRNGLALDLMHKVHKQMATMHAAEQASLHVRVSNAGALRLYSDPPLSYSIEKTIPKYYADGEDAHLMRAPVEHLAPPSDFMAEASQAVKYLSAVEAPKETVAANAPPATSPLLSRPPRRSWIPSTLTSIYREHPPQKMTASDI